MSWKTFDEPLPLDKRFVALYADGSGGQVFYRALDGGLIDAEGEELFVSDSEMDDWLMESDYAYWTGIDASWMTFREPLPVDTPFLAYHKIRIVADGFVLQPDEQEEGVFHLIGKGWPEGEFTREGAADYLSNQGYDLWLPYPADVQIWCRRGVEVRCHESISGGLR